MDQDAQTRPSLLIRIRDARDDDAWRQFVDLYAPLIHACCRRAGLQPAEAKDVTQDVFCSVITAIRRFEYDRRKGRFRGWLFAVVRSKLCNYLTRRRRGPRGSGRTVVQDLLAAEPAPQERETWDAEWARRVFQWAATRVRARVKALTWRAFWRTAVEGTAAQDVAGELGISVGAVYIAKSRVLSRIRIQVRQAEEP